MKDSMIELMIDPIPPRRLDYRIGIIGAGFIVSEQHLPAYRDMGFNPYAIASRTPSKAKKLARLFSIPKVYHSWEEMLLDDQIEVLDIAFPPEFQLEIVEAAVKYPNIQGILCQKPLAPNLADAKKIVELCTKAGIKLSVNSNMRYDPSVRAAKSLLNQGLLGQVVLANINMHAIPHWQPFLQNYRRLEILMMGIHHIDTFRYLFGDPAKITALTRTDPRTTFNHLDGISQYTFQYDDGLIATSLDDVWAWPGEGCETDFSIDWRIVGTEGIAKGSVFWYESTAKPSQIQFTIKQSPNRWYTPELNRSWFPDAFKGTMAQLLTAIENDTQPEISGTDNLHTIAAVECCYRSILEERTINFTSYLQSELYNEEIGSQ